jgi:hypothetical protein
MSWDTPPLQPPEPEQPHSGQPLPEQPQQGQSYPGQPQPPHQQDQPFTPQGGWIAPAPQNPYGQAPPPYGQPAPYNQPGPYDQQPQPYEQTVPFGQYPAQPVTYDQYGQPIPSRPGGGQWGQYGASAPFYGQPPKRSRTGLFVGLGVGAGVIAVGVTVAVAVSSSSGSGSQAAAGSTTASTSASASAASTSTDAQQTARTISIPQSAGSLNLLTNSDTTTRIAQLKSQLSGNSAYSNPQIGFYGIGSSNTYSVWLLAEDTTNIATFQDSVNALGVDAAARAIANAAGMKSTRTESAGPLGGAMLCGALAVNSVNVYACEWLDATSFGWVYFMPSVSQGNAQGYALDLRAGSEK